MGEHVIQNAAKFKLLDKLLTKDMPVPHSPLEMVKDLHPRHAEGPLPEIICSLELLPQRHNDFLHHLRSLMPVRQHGPHIPVQRLLLLRIKAEKLVVLGIKRLRHIEGCCIKVTATGLICRKK